MSKKGFTLFELLGVLTLISIVLVVLLGSYSSWGTAHALTGAARILEAGLQKGRTLAMTRHAYVGFEYGSYNTNEMQVISGFQLFLCTNENAVVEALLQQNNSDVISGSSLGITPAAPYQRISGHIRLAYMNEVQSLREEGSVIFFRPDGSVWSGIASDPHVHYLCVLSRERFNKDPLVRILRVDLATGLVTVLKKEITP